MTSPIRRRTVLSAAAAGLAAPYLARAAEPITIGGSLSLTGPLAVSGRAIQLSASMFRDDINAKGGIAGRPVKLVIYDDQSNPANSPQIYTKLIDVDNVNLLISNGTNLTAPAMPVVMQRNRMILAKKAYPCHRADAEHDECHGDQQAGGEPSVGFHRARLSRPLRRSASVGRSRTKNIAGAQDGSKKVATMLSATPTSRAAASMPMRSSMPRRRTTARHDRYSPHLGDRPAGRR